MRVTVLSQMGTWRDPVGGSFVPYGNLEGPPNTPKCTHTNCILARRSSLGPLHVGRYRIQYIKMITSLHSLKGQGQVIARNTKGRDDYNITLRPSKVITLFMNHPILTCRRRKSRVVIYLLAEPQAPAVSIYFWRLITDGTKRSYPVMRRSQITFHQLVRIFLFLMNIVKTS